MQYPDLIELRYLLVDVEKVLQYRSRMPSGDDPMIQYPGEWAWQPWKDIPEVVNVTRSNIEQ